MEKLSPTIIYENLNDLEKVDTVTSARYRQLAQAVLADLSVSETLRQNIAERLQQANHLLALKDVDGDESY
ncbi:hypothetical protein N836_01480 [Leptolyngbya sp. Heron Island J]|uniref:hypothetical protein n=1 Tax=Leptolyngbya sp. Heron Island J TaxID=1385935 RepID=UPI0003B9BF7A|nr:hypothetical protein [Leptolyngbya sp. Heron Island J]ESA33467.1 hypothetical protein N836_01480 [Leptolyngbya sp. Heron Island J]